MPFSLHLAAEGQLQVSASQGTSLAGAQKAHRVLLLVEVGLKVSEVQLSHRVVLGRQPELICSQNGATFDFVQENGVSVILPSALQ